MESGFEEVIRSLLEGRQHKRAIFELSDTKARNSKNFPLEAHDVA